MSAISWATEIENNPSILWIPVTIGLLFLALLAVQDMEGE